MDESASLAPEELIRANKGFEKVSPKTQDVYLRDDPFLRFIIRLQLGWIMLVCAFAAMELLDRVPPNVKERYFRLVLDSVVAVKVTAVKYASLIACDVEWALLTISAESQIACLDRHLKGKMDCDSLSVVHSYLRPSTSRGRWTIFRLTILTLFLTISALVVPFALL